MGEDKSFEETVAIPPDLDDALGGEGGVRLRVPQGASAWLHDHLKILRREILIEAGLLAKAEGHEEVEPKDVAAAALRYAPGTPVRHEPTLAERLTAAVNGLTVGSLLLAVVFAVLSRLESGSTAAYLDIAKVLAGVFVGGAAAAVTGGGLRSRRRRGSRPVKHRGAIE